MKPTRSGPGVGHVGAGLRTALGGLGLVGIMATLALSVPGSASPFSAQASASDNSHAAYGLANAASSASMNASAGLSGAAALAECTNISFAPAVNYGVGMLPFSVAEGLFNKDS